MGLTWETGYFMSSANLNKRVHLHLFLNKSFLTVHKHLRCRYYSTVTSCRIILYSLFGQNSFPTYIRPWMKFPVRTKMLMMTTTSNASFLCIHGGTFPASLASRMNFLTMLTSNFLTFELLKNLCSWYVVLIEAEFLFLTQDSFLVFFTSIWLKRCDGSKIDPQVSA